MRQHNLIYNSYHTQQGFTLTELCVAVGIIGMLLAIILPAYQTAIGIAQATKCRINLRTLGQAFHLYSQDYFGMLPHSDQDSESNHNYCWTSLLDSYLDKGQSATIKQCASWNGDDDSEQHSIKMNAGLCPKERPPETQADKRRGYWYFPRLVNIRQKSKTVLLIDGRMDEHYETRTDTTVRNGFQDVANRHRGGANILTVDGTVIFVPAESLKISLGEIGWTGPGGFIWQAYHP